MVMPKIVQCHLLKILLIFMDDDHLYANHFDYSMTVLTISWIAMVNSGTSGLPIYKQIGLFDELLLT